MSGPRQSVFISYAREDRAATRRIADALNAAGIEVWCDQDELEGGDDWDQKIRRQIKECSLFIPIVSARTEARREAYFRLEWKLAEERTHLMAEGTTFLLPLAIDGTPEANALVPESFRRAQWTRLPLGEPTIQFVDRVQALLNRQRSQPATPPSPPTTLGATQSKKWVLAAAAVILAIIAILPFWWSRNSTALAPVAVDRKSIAVLPFANMSDDKENAYFADGVHEDLLTQLARIGDLKVTSRTSVAEYRNTVKNVRQIGAELRVATLLEGSVRRSGDQVRVTAQLIEVQSDRHLWAKTYDREWKDVFAIQAELAAEIAQSLHATLSPEVRSTLARIPTQNMAAYELLLRQQAVNNRDGVLPPNVEQMIELLQQAVKLDPGLALAWARLGTMHARQIFDFQDVSPERLARAQAAINRALELAPNAPEVRQELGNFYYYALRDYARAEAICGEILGLAPHNVEVLTQLGYVLRRQGRFRDSNKYLEKVLALDPRHFRALGNMYYNFIRIRDFPGARQTAGRLMALNPSDLSWQVLQQQAVWRETGRFDAYDTWRSAQTPGVETKVAAIAVMDFRRALAQRDFAAAERLLPSLRNTEQGSSVWEALFWRANSNADAARQAAEAGVKISLATLRQQPDNPKELAQLALLHAILGEKKAAWSEYRRASELIPASRDAFQGTDVAIYGPRIHAILGERTPALTGLQQTLRSFSYESSASVATDLAFAAWWDEPEFKSIVADPANDALLQ